MRTAASIVTYHTDSDELRRCLASLGGGWIERIFIVDNSRNTQTEQVAKEYANVIYIPSDNNGYGAGHNIALRQSIQDGFDYHLVINSDIVFEPKKMGEMLEYMEHHGDVGTLQPRILNPDGTPQYTVRMLPTPFDLILRRFLPKFMMKKRRARYELRHLDQSKPSNVPYHQGSFMLLRIEALKEVGLFDERFFMYPEDIDLTRRLHVKYRTIYLPNVEITHDHRAASYKSLRMMRIHIVNMIRYFNKWGWVFDAERRRFNRPF